MLSRILVACAILSGAASPAAAQRYAFERTFDTAAAPTLDASTNRGKITVSTGAGNRIVVRGTVTVRVAIDVPANAMEIAQRLAKDPPITREGDHVQLRPPSDDTERRAVTIAYDVIVPANTRVTAISDSGALSLSGVRGEVTARTQSGALAFSNLGGAATITTGSGEVTVDDASGVIAVTTASSAITARGVRSDVRMKTGSGAVSIDSRGAGDLDITTSSSAITVTGATHGLRATSQSGRIRVDGRPGADWHLSSSSGALDVMLDTKTNATIDAATRSGSIRVTGLQVSGTQVKQSVQGTVGTGGPTVRLTAGSGSIDLRGR